MQLTRQGDYAFRLVYALARADGGPLTQKEVARAEDVPEAFLAKVAQQLSRAGLITSSRGAKGGMVLARPAEAITLLEVIEAVEGAICLNLCLRGTGACSREAFCPVHPVWVRAQEALLQVLGSVTIAELVREGNAIDPNGFFVGANPDKNGPNHPQPRETLGTHCTPTPPHTERDDSV